MADPPACANARIPRDNTATELQRAVDAFLSQPALSVQTRRSYRLTLSALTAALETAGAEPTPAAIEAAARLRWAPSRRRPGTATPRPRAPSCATPPVTACWASCPSSLTGGASRPTAHARCPRPRSSGSEPPRHRAARDKTLWRLLYETAARANEALALNVEDLDLPNRRAAVRGKKGCR